MSKFVKLTDVKQILLEMSKEKTRSVGWGDVLMERLKDHSIEVSEDGEDYLRGYNDGWYAHEVITNAKLHIDKPRGFTLKTEKGYGNYSEDCISKSALISFIDAGHLRNSNEKCYSENDVVDLIKSAPSAVPTCQKNRQVEREEGEWELASDNDGEYGICSICGNDADFTHYGEPYHYCPNCGAKMKGN